MGFCDGVFLYFLNVQLVKSQSKRIFAFAGHSDVMKLVTSLWPLALLIDIMNEQDIFSHDKDENIETFQQNVALKTKLPGIQALTDTGKSRVHTFQSPIIFIFS